MTWPRIHSVAWLIWKYSLLLCLPIGKGQRSKAWHFLKFKIIIIKKLPIFTSIPCSSSVMKIWHLKHDSAVDPQWKVCAHGKYPKTDRDDWKGVCFFLVLFFLNHVGKLIGSHYLPCSPTLVDKGGISVFYFYSHSEKQVNEMVPRWPFIPVMTPSLRLRFYVIERLSTTVCSTFSS